MNEDIAPVRVWNPASPSQQRVTSADTSRDGTAVRVLLANADEIIVKGLREMLALHPDRVEMVGTVAAIEDWLSMSTPSHADVVLLDLARRPSGALDLSAEMVARCAPSRVVIFTDDADERRLFDALRLGVSGYLLKSLANGQLVDHLVRAGHGEVVVDPTFGAKMAMWALQHQDGQAWSGREIGLSRRESEVLCLLADGLSNREIAASLIVGEETVKTHLRSIYRKMGVNDRAQAISSALRRGILT